MLRTLVAVFVLLVAAIGNVSFAQEDSTRPLDNGTRSVKGTVSDKEGKPISGAVVLLKDTKTLQVRSFVTQADGVYRFFGLSTNNAYDLRAQANGASSSSKTLSSFDNRKEATVDLKLK